MNNVLRVALGVVWRFENVILRVCDGGQGRTKHGCKVNVITGKITNPIGLCNRRRDVRIISIWTV